MRISRQASECLLTTARRHKPWTPRQSAFEYKRTAVDGVFTRRDRHCQLGLEVAANSAVTLSDATLQHFCRLESFADLRDTSSRLHSSKEESLRRANRISSTTASGNTSNLRRSKQDGVWGTQIPRGAFRLPADFEEMPGISEREHSSVPPPPPSSSQGVVLPTLRASRVSSHQKNLGVTRLSSHPTPCATRNTRCQADLSLQSQLGSR